MRKKTIKIAVPEGKEWNIIASQIAIGLSTMKGYTYVLAYMLAHSQDGLYYVAQGSRARICKLTGQTLIQYRNNLEVLLRMGIIKKNKRGIGNNIWYTIDPMLVKMYFQLKRRSYDKRAIAEI